MDIWTTLRVDHMPPAIVALLLIFFLGDETARGPCAIAHRGRLAPGGRGQDAPARSSPRLRPEAGGSEPHSGYALS